MQYHSPIYFQYKIDCKVTIELLDTESDDTAQNFNNAQNYSNYVDRLSNPAATGTGSESGASITGVTTGGAGNVEIKTEKPDDDLVSSDPSSRDERVSSFLYHYFSFLFVCTLLTVECVAPIYQSMRLLRQSLFFIGFYCICNL